MEAVAFSLREAIADTLKPFGVHAQQKGLELRYEIAPDVPAVIVGDPVRLKQVLTNLIGNAIKFTERGHVAVSVSQERRRDGRVVLHFAIADTGIGIQADHQATIFEAFRQADGSTTRKFGGTGLGLGHLDLAGPDDGRPHLGRERAGRRQHVSFHRVVRAGRRRCGGPAEAGGHRRRAGASRSKCSSSTTTMVNQRVVLRMLQKRGHTVTVAGDGREALDALEREPFDLVLMDVQMPEMGGFEATAAIRAREQQTGRHTRIVAMTAHAMTGDRERCLAAGMDGYLSKPIDPQ